MKIEKDIPLPSNEIGRFTDLFRTMEIGDSIVLPIENYSGVDASARRVGVKIVRRKISEVEFRVWKSGYRD